MKELVGIMKPKPARSGHTPGVGVGIVGGSTANVKVCVRVRPANERETGRCIVRVLDGRLLTFDPRQEEEPFFYHGVQQAATPGYLKKPNKDMQYMFDCVFDSTASNEDVFHRSTRDTISSLMDGYNCSVFVYGATGAGKTFTMLGHRDQPGITYLTMQELFRSIEQRRPIIDFDICVSYLEIYNENVHDLLQPSGPLQLREDRKYGVQIAGLVSKTIATAQELLDMLDKGNKNRTQHPTDANSESSRSHAVFQVYVKMRTKSTNQAKIVKLSMIDLAGSERASATGCVGERFKEGANINRSLLSLGNCINKLADGSKFIPYRDSKLTRLLKDSLGGNCRTVMIANIAPTLASYEDTYNTLKYAERASKIQHKIKKNIISCDGHVAQYIKQVEELSLQVARLEAELAEYKNKENNVVNSVSNDVDNVHLEKQKKLHIANLEKYANKYFAKLNEVLKKLQKQRSLAARAARKTRAAKCLAAICSEASDSQLKDACQKDVTRLEMSSNALLHQCELLQSDMKTSLEVLHSSKIEFDTKSDEILSECSSLEYLVNNFKSKRDLLISEKKVQHVQYISSLLHDEINNLNNFVNDSLGMLKKYYLRFKSQGMFTSEMEKEYNTLIRQAKSSQVVTWEGEEINSNYLQFITNLNTDVLTDIPRLSVNNTPKSPLLLINNEDDPLSCVAENEENNVNVTYVESTNASPPLLKEISLFSSLKRKSPVQQIDPNSLNSTFVLNQKTNDGPPTKKMNIKSFKPKKVLYERTNLPNNDRFPVQKALPVVNKVIPFRRPISTLNKDIKTGFGSSVERLPQVIKETPTVQVGFKAVRPKERSALASTALPYIRLNSRR